MIILKLHISPIKLSDLDKISLNKEKVKVKIEVETEVNDGEVCIPDGTRKLIKFNNANCCCENITNVKIPATVTIIGPNAFEGCGISILQIPSSVKEIGRCAFFACHELERVEIPDSVTKMGEGLFWSCPKLQQIVVPVGTSEKFKKMIDEDIHHLIVEK